MAQIRRVLTYVEIGVADLGRAEEFYSGLLGFPVAKTTVDTDGHRVVSLGTGPAVVRLIEVGPAGLASGWEPDNRQRGIRHFGMKVAGIDTWASRLAAAGVAFDLEPFDAFGGVQIAFFRDPDGACLELVQGYVQHNNLWSAELAQQEVDADRGWDGTPRFDHVAITVPDLDSALAVYAGRLGFGGIGQLIRPDDDPERGFLITNLRAGSATTLEVFTFDQPVFPCPGVGEPERLGLRAIGIRGLAADELAPGDVPLRAG